MHACEIVNQYLYSKMNIQITKYMYPFTIHYNKHLLCDMCIWFTLVTFFLSGDMEMNAWWVLSLYLKTCLSCIFYNIIPIKRHADDSIFLFLTCPEGFQPHTPHRQIHSWIYAGQANPRENTHFKVNWTWFNPPEFCN